MNITLTPELQKRIAEKVQRGDIGSADALVEHALTFYLGFEEGSADEEEFLETNAAIHEALAGCGKTASFMKIATHIMPDKRYAGPKSCLDKLSACICGSFCPLLLRAGTLLP